MTALTFTTSVLILLAIMSVVASVVALLGLMFPTKDRRHQVGLNLLLLAIALVGGGLFVYRLAVVHHSWQPLESHVDGLILISVLVVVMLLFLQTRGRLQSISAFVLPILTMLMLWAVLANGLTFQAIGMGTVWTGAHRLGVYLGSVFYLVAAGAGVMFLYVRRQLRRKQSLSVVHRLPSLESVEQLIILTATLGFALITLGLVTGVIIIASGSEAGGLAAWGDGWWYSPKVLLATLAWVVYAVVMNVRYSVTFRGSRAAWLSILGLVFVVGTFVAALSMTAGTLGDARDEAGQTSYAPGSGDGGGSLSRDAGISQDTFVAGGISGGITSGGITSGVGAGDASGVGEGR